MLVDTDTPVMDGGVDEAVVSCSFNKLLTANIPSTHSPSLPKWLSYLIKEKVPHGTTLAIITSNTYILTSNNILYS